jgi:hypothetical protein
LADIEAKLARRLKRSLQDEQNDLLDRLRSAKGKVVAEGLIPSPDEHAGRHLRTAEPFLREAAVAGATFAGASGGEAATDEPNVGDIARELAHAICGPLRRQLQRAAESGAADDEGGLASRFGMAYREWKGERIESVAGDAVMAAFARGQFAAVASGTPMRWIVDDQGQRCPDCDDNALAGPIGKGQEYPTGQQHPPAHAGCRCLLLPALPEGDSRT